MSTKSDAYDRLTAFEATKPDSYQSQYTDQIADLTNTINDRSFSYDYAKDPAYNTYKQNYTLKADKANTNAQAASAALSGGYGSSWATTAGANAYTTTMDGLDDVIEGLYSQALNQYNTQTDTLNSQLSALTSAESLAQSEYQNDMTNWYNELNYLQNAYNEASNEQANTTSSAISTGGSILSSVIGVLLPYALAFLL